MTTTAPATMPQSDPRILLVTVCEDVVYYVLCIKGKFAQGARMVMPEKPDPQNPPTLQPCTYDETAPDLQDRRLWTRATQGRDAAAWAYFEMPPEYNGTAAVEGAAAAARVCLVTWLQGPQNKDDQVLAALGHPWNGLAYMEELAAFWATMCQRVEQYHTAKRSRDRFQIAPLQYERARELGVLHGHLWAMAMPEKHPVNYHLARPWTVALIEEISRIHNIGNKGPLGILAPDWDETGMALTHTTGTGRLTWSVYGDGSVVLSVARPAHALPGATDPKDETPQLILSASITPDNKLNVSVDTSHPKTVIKERHLCALRSAIRVVLYTGEAAMNDIKATVLIKAAFDGLGLPWPLESYDGLCVRADEGHYEYLSDGVRIGQGDYATNPLRMWNTDGESITTAQLQKALDTGGFAVRI